MQQDVLELRTTQEVPLCRDCRHRDAGMCYNPATAARVWSPVMGSELWHVLCDDARRHGPCGPEARLHQRRGWLQRLFYNSDSGV